MTFLAVTTNPGRILGLGEKWREGGRGAVQEQHTLKYKLQTHLVWVCSCTFLHTATFRAVVQTVHKPIGQSDTFQPELSVTSAVFL